MFVQRDRLASVPTPISNNSVSFDRPFTHGKSQIKEIFHHLHRPLPDHFLPRRSDTKEGFSTQSKEILLDESKSKWENTGIGLVVGMFFFPSWTFSGKRVLLFDRQMLKSGIRTSIERTMDVRTLHLFLIEWILREHCRHRLRQCSMYIAVAWWFVSRRYGSKREQEQGEQSS